MNSSNYFINSGSTHCHAIKIKLCGNLSCYRKSRIWEMRQDKFAKSLAKNQDCARFHIRKNVLPKFIKLCMETPCLCPFQGNKYGRRKPTETSVFDFCCLCMNSLLEELIKINIILIQGMFRE